MGSHTSKSFTVTIIGGGIGGLTLAAGLLRRKVPVQIYEAAPEFKEIGLGLSIGPAAHRAMPLIDPQIRDIYDSLVTTHADSPGYEEYRQTWFEVVWASGVQEGELLMDLKALPSGQTTLRRSSFLDALVRLIPEGIVHFGKRLESFSEGGDGVELRFDDGSTVLADVVVGCDGIKSRVKESMIPEESRVAQPRFSGMYGYRAVLDMEDMVNAVGDQRARVSTMYIGKGAYGISYPINRAKKVNVGVYILSEGWDHDTWVRPAERKDMERDTEDMGRYVKSLVKVGYDLISAGGFLTSYRTCLIHRNGLSSSIPIYPPIVALELPFSATQLTHQHRIKVLVQDRQLRMPMFWRNCSATSGLCLRRTSKPRSRLMMRFDDRVAKESSRRARRMLICCVSVWMEWVMMRIS